MGNFFFFRSVFDYQKVMALSIASCFTNLLGKSNCDKLYDIIYAKFLTLVNYKFYKL